MVLSLLCYSDHRHQVHACKAPSTIQQAHGMKAKVSIRRLNPKVRSCCEFWLITLIDYFLQWEQFPPATFQNFVKNGIFKKNYLFMAVLGLCCWKQALYLRPAGAACLCSPWASHWLRWLQLQSTGSRCTGSVVGSVWALLLHACGIVPGQGSSVPCFGRRILNYCAAVRCLVAQSCLTLCDPMDCSPPGSSVHGILQARILEWVAFPFSRASSQLRNQTQVSRIAGGFFAIWVTRETQEDWSGSLLPLQGVFSTQE